MMKPELKIEPLVTKLLVALDEPSRVIGGSERALYLLLMIAAPYLHLDPNNLTQFHKDFRQIDVTPSGEIDMALWHLLNSSKMFWTIAEHLFPQS